MIVGAGHNGLVCAAHLAAAGVLVTVFEQAQRPGGAVSSHADTLPAFRHDTCAGFFPLTLASPAFDGLGVHERVNWMNPGLAMAHPFSDGTAIVLARDLERTIESLDAAPKGAGRGWREVAGPLLARRDRVVGAGLTPSFPPVRDGLALALQYRRDGEELGRQLLASSDHSSEAVTMHSRPLRPGPTRCAAMRATRRVAASTYARELAAHELAWHRRWGETNRAEPRATLDSPPGVSPYVPGPTSRRPDDCR